LNNLFIFITVPDKIEAIRHFLPTHFREGKNKNKIKNEKFGSR
jgi:hypothetical protein